MGAPSYKAFIEIMQFRLKPGSLNLTLSEQASLSIPSQMVPGSCLARFYLVSSFLITHTQITQIQTCLPKYLLLTYFRDGLYDESRAPLVTQTVKNLPCNAGHLGSMPGSGRTPTEGNGNPLQHFCLENSTNRGA